MGNISFAVDGELYYIASAKLGEGDLPGENAPEAVVNEAPQTAAVTAEEPPAESSPSTMMSLLTTILPFVILIGAFFLMTNKQRKTEKAKVAMRSSLQVGDKVMTNSGFFGKIVDLGVDSVVVEFGDSRGIRVPVKKEAIEGVGEPVLKQEL